MITNSDFVLKSPGVPRDSAYVEYARVHQVPVYMSAALFVKQTHATIIGVTGGLGCAVTTRMIYELLRDAGRTVTLCTKRPPISILTYIEEVTEHDQIVVLELDSLQLQGFEDLAISPALAIIRSLHENVPPYYEGDRARYILDECSIARHQKSDDILITPLDVVREVKGTPISSRRIIAGPVPVGYELQKSSEANCISAGLAHAAGYSLGLDPSQMIQTLWRFEWPECE